MGHAISAILTPGSIDGLSAERLGARTVKLDGGLTLIPLNHELVDAWSEREAVAGLAGSDPVLNANVVHHLMAMLAPGSPFALIETDYFGGAGDQAAAVYASGRTLMEPRRAPIGPINEALRHLGVTAAPGLDEFDTVGLGRLRTLEHLLGS